MTDVFSEKSSVRIVPHDRPALLARVLHSFRRDPGWVSFAYGGVTSPRFYSEAHISMTQAAHVSAIPCISESDFEHDVLLSLLEAIPGPVMTFAEIGAGWGAQTVTVCTAIRSGVLETGVRRVLAYAVEAEPTHYRFLVEALRHNWLDAVPLHAAVSDTLGWGRLSARQSPTDSYGQALAANGNLEVPTITLAWLFRTFGLESIDLLHMDIQGAEPKALAGGLSILDRIRFLVVCPHHTEHMPIIDHLLGATHRPILSFGPRSGYHEVPGFLLPVHMPQDGLTVWAHKDLCGD